MKKESKVVLKTAAITFLMVAILLIITYFVMLFCFTPTLGDFFYSLGCENITASLYYRSYEKSDDITYIYKALSLEIKQRDEGNIVKYYEEFASHNDYDAFLTRIMDSNEKSSLNILEKSLTLDEINIFNCAYVDALLELDKQEKAINFALDNFRNNSNYTYKNIGGYSLNKVITHIDNDAILSEGLVDKIQVYFNDLLEVFENNFNQLDNLKKSYMVRLGNRIMTVGNDLNYFYTSENSNKIENLQKMKMVNEKIMELI